MTTSPNPLASNTALDIVKLVETILLNLPIGDRLGCQRVSKTWKNIIDGSTKLQKALFFLPATKDLAFFYQRIDRTDYPCAAPSVFILASDDVGASLLSLSDCDIKGILERYNKAGSPVWKESRVLINPLLVARFPWFRNLFGSQMNDQHRKPGKMDLKTRGTKFMRPEASWRRMLISQPPIGAVAVNVLGVHGYTSLGIGGGPVTMEKLRGLLVRFAQLPIRIGGVDALERCNSGKAVGRLAEEMRRVESDRP